MFLLSFIYFHIYYSCKRSTSLNSALKKNGIRGDKKVVQFADALGLDLVQVRPFETSEADDGIFGTTPPLCVRGLVKLLFSIFPLFLKRIKAYH